MLVSALSRSAQKSLLCSVEIWLLRTVLLVEPEEVLPGDGYLRYLKPFRTVEDLYVQAALLGCLLMGALVVGMAAGALCGVGLTIGNLLGGRLADWRLMPSLIGIFSVLAVVLAAFHLTSAWLWPSVATVVVWGLVSFAAGTPLQARVISQAGDAPSLASTLNIGAFNLGNAIGAWLGGAVITAGGSLQSIPLVAACVTLCALALAVYVAWLDQRGAVTPTGLARCEAG